MKKVQAIWAVLLGTLIGWLLPSCKTSHAFGEQPVLYGPAPIEDTLHTVICLYGVPPFDVRRQKPVAPEENTESTQPTPGEAPVEL